MPWPARHSYLIEITAEVLAHHDADTGLPLVDVIADAAERKGTGRWTAQTALDLGIPVSGIAEAVFARFVSGYSRLRATGAALPGPASAYLGERDAARFADQVEQALYTSKVISYAQGLHQIQAASDAYG